MSVENKTAESKKKKSEWKTPGEIYAEFRERVREKRRRRQEGESIVDHLTELRNRLFVVVITFIILTVAAFAFVKDITELISLVLELPLILYQIWAFAAPALTKKEKIVVSLCLLAGLVFFALGCVFCYIVAMPMMVRFLSSYSTSSLVSASVSFQNYLNFVIGLVLTFGIVFEMPIIAMLLSQFGILKPAFMKKVRKYAILVIFIIAAIITPPDVVSQIMVGVPMIFLYELSILFCQLTYRKKKEKEIDEYGEDLVEMEEAKT